MYIFQSRPWIFAVGYLCVCVFFLRYLAKYYRVGMKTRIFVQCILLIADTYLMYRNLQ